MSKSLKSSPFKKLKKGIILAVIFLVIVVVCFKLSFAHDCCFFGGKNKVSYDGCRK